MCSNPDMDPNPFTPQKPDNLRCMFTVEPFQLAAPSQETDSDLSDVRSVGSEIYFSVHYHSLSREACSQLHKTSNYVTEIRIKKFRLQYPDARHVRGGVWSAT